MECKTFSQEQRITNEDGGWIMTFLNLPDKAIQIKATPRKADNIRAAWSLIREIANRNGGQTFVCHPANTPACNFLARSFLGWMVSRPEMVVFYIPAVDFGIMGGF